MIRGVSCTNHCCVYYSICRMQQLTNKTLETPHEPYVTIDESFWPPYLEMLLRNGIAIRHPEDCNKIRLESFQ